MARIGLSAYAVRIREYGAPADDFELLGDFGGNDLLPFFDHFVRSLAVVIPPIEKVARIRRRSVVSRDRTVAGVCECGDYGYEAEGWNATTHTVSYHRAIQDAELLPFYFLAELPQARDEGILLLQRFSQFGMRGAFVGALAPAFADTFPDYRIAVNPISSGTAWERFFRDGEMRVVRFIRYDVPNTPEAALTPDSQWEKRGYTELAMHAGRFTRLPFGLDRFVPGQRPVTQIIEFPDFRYDTIKVQIELNGTTQTFDLGEPLGRMSLDISGDVTLGRNGHPTFETIDPRARAFLATVRAAMGHA
jgi:hypothetical protein